MSLSNPHIPFAALVDLAEGRLASDELAAMEPHLAGCGDCRDRVARLERTLELMRSDVSESAPEYAVNRAVSLIRGRADPESSMLRRVLATLKFDSLQLAPALGVRAGAPSERQLLFAAGDNEVQLEVIQAGESWAVSGQVLGPCKGGKVELRGPAASARTELNEMCEFMLPPVPEGGYALTLRLSEVELEVTDLRLGA